jgi:hypothetical protein
MPEIVHWTGFVLGLGIVGFTLGSMINTMVVPRNVSSRITYLVWRTVPRMFLALVRRLPTYQTKDSAMALLGPVSLLVLLSVWLLLLLGGYALLLWLLLPGNFGDAVRASGSSLLPLGIASSPAGAPTAISFLAAANGLVTIALLIGYLPTIYSAYSRREELVTMLESRAIPLVRAT